MPELNKANRQVCDVDIRILKTMAPFLFFDTANTTTVGLTGDAVYAMKKGTRAIAFQNPIEGTLTVEAQVIPFKFYAMLSDGVIDSDAFVATKSEIKCETEGELTLPENVKEGTVFVYKEGEWGEKAIQGTVEGTKFTATENSDLAANTTYLVAYVVERKTGVKKVAFNNKKVPKDFFITMSTVDKDEDGVLTPFIITAYKASVQRNFEMSFSSEGDPVTYSITFDLLEDKNGNVLDMIEDTENADDGSKKK